MNSHIVCKIIPENKRIIVPIKWIEGVDEVSVFNGCLQQGQVRRVFYSDDESKHADFQLPTRDKFDVTDGCYRVRLLQILGKRGLKIFL